MTRGLSKPESSLPRSLVQRARGELARRFPELRHLGAIPRARRGAGFARSWRSRSLAGPRERSGPLQSWFEARTEGRGVVNWEHYFPVYERHLCRFVGQDVAVAEVGIFSGGGLEMWHHYFGPSCTVYGVDIEPACEAYEDAKTRVFIGDQGDREFWAWFRSEVPELDILVDDGGHLPEQQMVTLEEMLPHLRPGGVYICEDIVDTHNAFSAFALALADELHAGGGAPPTGWQREIDSVHVYPFMVVIEKRRHPLEQFSLERHGTEWAPIQL